MQQTTLLRVFISSPSDVNAEREHAAAVIKAISETCEEVGLPSTCAIRWETSAAQTRRGVSIQDGFLDRVRDCDIFVLILYKSGGSTSTGHELTNTEREVEVALKRLDGGANIHVLTYFRRLRANQDAGPKERRVRRIRRELQARDVRFTSYGQPADFREKFTHDLYKAVLGFEEKPDHERKLRSFWALGRTPEQSRAEVNILYPPVDRRFMVDQAAEMDDRPDSIWLHRLAPHIVFENYKAIQKIQKTLRASGITAIRDFGVASIPGDNHQSNRVWICLPRNQPAAAHFSNRYARQARFEFVAGASDQRSLRWKARGGKWFGVSSPLNRYLETQRKDSPGGSLRADHLNIVARDFAVVARFSDELERRAGGQSIKDYFFSGLRGLGTWGSAWAVDKRPHLFEAWKDEPDAPIQLLVEVTYLNGQILDVRDVSGESADYFEAQNSPSEITRLISRSAGL